MVLMGVLEMERKYDLSVHGGIEQNVGGVHYNASRVSLFWQTPQFLLAGVAEAFTLVSGKSVSLTYLDLVPPVPSGTSGDELSPSNTVAGSISRVTPVYTHRLQVIF